MHHGPAQRHRAAWAPALALCAGVIALWAACTPEDSAPAQQPTATDAAVETPATDLAPSTLSGAVADPAAPVTADGSSPLIGVTNGPWALQYAPELTATVGGYWWVRDGLDARETAALEALFAIAVEDTAMARDVAAAPWLGDGVTAEEAAALGLLGYTAQDAPESARALAGAPWLLERITPGAVEAFRTFARIAVVDPEAAAALARSPFVQDGVHPGDTDAIDLLTPYDTAIIDAVAAMPWLTGPLDARSLEGVARLAELTRLLPAAAPPIMALPWVQDGVSPEEGHVILLLGEMEDAAIVAAILALPWAADGIAAADEGGTSLEVAALDVVTDVGRSAPANLPVVLAEPWVQDGLSVEEVEAVRAFSRFNGADRAGALLTLPWVQDGAQDHEAQRIVDLAALSAQQPSLLTRMVAVPWVVDGVTATEVEALSVLIGQRRLDDSATGLPWLADGVTETEVEALRVLGSFGDEWEQAAALPWIADGVTETELEALRILGGFGEDWEIAAALPWIADGVTETERNDLTALRDANRVSWGDDSVLPAFAWVTDGLNPTEREGLVRLASAAARDAGLIDAVADGWLADGITTVEVDALGHLLALARADAGAARRIVAMPFLDAVDPMDVLALWSLRQVADGHAGDFAALMRHPAAADGFTDVQAPLLALASGLAAADSGLLPRLLAAGGSAIERRVVATPGAPAFHLAIVRTQTGAERTMDLLVHALRVGEDVMDVPLDPRAIVVLFHDDPVLDGVGGHNPGGNTIFMQTAYDRDDESAEANAAPRLIAREVAQVWWRDGPDWLKKGAASFLEAFNEGRRVGAPLDAAYPPCPYARSIARLAFLAPDITEDLSACTYALGERLFLDLHRALGTDAFQRGFRALQQTLQDDPGAASVATVRAAFEASDNPAAQAVIDRWWNSTAPYAASPFGAGAPDPSLPAINGRLDRAYAAAAADATAAFRFTQAEAADGLWAILSISFSAGNGSLPLTVLVAYEDGHVFHRTTVTVETPSTPSGGTHAVRVGGATAPGRYTVVVYDGERKVAQTSYTITA